MIFCAFSCKLKSNHAFVDFAAENAAKCVKEQVETGSNTRGSAEYRKHLAGVLVRRAVCKLAGK